MLQIVEKCVLARMTLTVCLDKWCCACFRFGRVLARMTLTVCLDKWCCACFRFGGVLAGKLCALWTLYDQMTQDKSVDVYQLTKLYHLKRPAIVGTQVQTYYTNILMQNRTELYYNSGRCPTAYEVHAMLQYNRTEQNRTLLQLRPLPYGI